MINFLIMIAFSINIYASHLYSNFCIEDDFYFNYNKEFCYRENNSTSFICSNQFDASLLRDNYIYKNSVCQSDYIYGLKRVDYNFLMAFTGLIIGFIILYMLVSK